MLLHLPYSLSKFSYLVEIISNTNTTSLTPISKIYVNAWGIPNNIYSLMIAFENNPTLYRLSRSMFTVITFDLIQFFITATGTLSKWTQFSPHY